MSISVRASTVWVEAVHLTIPVPLEGVLVVALYVVVLALVLGARISRERRRQAARARARSRYQALPRMAHKED